METGHTTASTTEAAAEEGQQNVKMINWGDGEEYGGDGIPFCILLKSIVPFFFSFKGCFSEMGKTACPNTSNCSIWKLDTPLSTCHSAMFPPCPFKGFRESLVVPISFPSFLELVARRGGGRGQHFGILLKHK